MNRKRRKAAQRFKRRYGKATNPWWQSQAITTDTPRENLGEAMRRIYMECSSSDTLPDVMMAPCVCGGVVTLAGENSHCDNCDEPEILIASSQETPHG